MSREMNFATLVDPDRLRIADPAAHPIQGGDHVFPAITEPNIQHRRITRERVHDRQDAQLLAHGKLVMRIYRLQTEDGERAIGRLVSQEQLLNVYARLGLDCQIEMTPQEVFGAVMDAKTTLSLLGGYQLRRSLVMGQPRLELNSASGTALPALKAMGCFTEVIQWKTRVFIPVDGTEVLVRVLAEYPVGGSAADAAA